MDAAIQNITVQVYRIPTDFPEADGTYAWDSTTLAVVHAQGGGNTGLGYTYASRAVAELIRDKLAPIVTGHDALAVTAAWDAMV